MAAILPASQSEQSAPVVAWYWPMAQSVHSVAAAVAKRPLVHTLHVTAL
jgi:hypothetical protein